MTSYLVDTENSTYELDVDDSLVKRVRRLAGRADPTPHQGPDGEWKDLPLEVELTLDLIQVDRPMWFVWNVTEDGTMQSTATSPVVGIERAWDLDG